MCERDRSHLGEQAEGISHVALPPRQPLDGDHTYELLVDDHRRHEVGLKVGARLLTQALPGVGLQAVELAPVHHPLHLGGKANLARADPDLVAEVDPALGVDGCHGQEHVAIRIGLGRAPPHRYERAPRLDHPVHRAEQVLRDVAPGLRREQPVDDRRQLAHEAGEKLLLSLDLRGARAGRRELAFERLFRALEGANPSVELRDREGQDHEAKAGDRQEAEHAQEAHVTGVKQRACLHR